MTRERTIRQSQLVTSFGPGAIYDIGDESLVAVDTRSWPVTDCRKIELPRLQRILGAFEGFREPPVASGYGSRHPRVPYFRFPRWLFCPKCRRMIRWNGTLEKETSENGDVPRCRWCAGPPRPSLVPMRFVVVCSEGHLGDVDWYKWAHSRQSVAESGQCSSERPELSFRTRGDFGGSLQALRVECLRCGCSRDFNDLLNPLLLRNAGIFCPGKQPWQRWEERVERCEGKTQAVQRGSSNVYYPYVVSALDIADSDREPTVSNAPEAINSHALIGLLRELCSSYEHPREEPAIQRLAEKIATDLNVEAGVVVDLVEPTEETGDDDGCAPSSRTGNEISQQLLEEEWSVLSSEAGSVCEGPLAMEVEDLVDAELSRLIDKVALVTRLREVRALRGFNRLLPRPEAVPPDIVGVKNWLPGIEVFGEGIFISFRSNAITHWLEESSAALDGRVSPMASRLADSPWLCDIVPKPTPKFVMIHTFAHVLIRQLCFECGYDSASLRERIYSSEETGPMAGLLVYTADAESEGSLGGLVRQGRHDRLAGTIRVALERAMWCSSDPVCSELSGQGMEGLNRAACHACTLLPETSCVFHNVLLDRMVLLGRMESPVGRGFFAEIVDSIRKVGEKG